MNEIRNSQAPRIIVVLAVLVLMLTMSILVMAGTVFDRATRTMTAGVATWTNGVEYAALELNHIWIERGMHSPNTVTVTRVTSDNVYTHAVCTVVCSTNTASGRKAVGDTSAITNKWLKYGDKLVHSSTVGSNATAVIEYEVQKH